MRRNKRILFLILLGFCLPSFLFAGTFLGVSQGQQSTTLEVGILNRRAEQHLSFSLPTVCTNPKDYYKAPSVAATISVRTLRFRPVVIAGGIKSQISWECTNGYILGLGGSVTLSYEFIGKGGVLFLEGSYLPWVTTQGSLSTDLGEKQLQQWIYIGYRHVF
ncbi:MAG: hypothetical protein ACQ5SW_13930 [Sphaerochaetaceae bacterium]